MMPRTVRRSPRVDGDRGSMSIEWALLTPLLILLMMVVVQFAMVYHARQVALAGAQAGARVARGEPDGDWRAKAEQRAQSSVDAVGPRLLTGREIAAGGDGERRWVVVRGKAVQVIPFMSFRVDERSGGPVECFRPDVGSGTECE